MSAASYKDSHDYCRRQFREQKLAFYFLSYLFSSVERKALGALLAYSDFVNRSFKNPDKRAQHLKACEELLERLYGHRRWLFHFEFELALEQTVTRYNIPRSLLWQMVEAKLLEAYYRQPQDEDELVDLGSHFGGVWGQLAGHLLGKSSSDIQWAKDVGVCAWLAERALFFNEEASAKKICAAISWQQADFVSREDLRQRFMQFANANIEKQKAKLKLDDGRLEGLLKIVLDMSCDVVNQSATNQRKPKGILETTLFEKARLVPKLIKVFA